MPLDEDFLRQARQARDRLFDLQSEADEAQVGYAHATRRLHGAGASLREIAEELGLSYQRVHQIVDPGSGKGAIKDCQTDRACSFCGSAKRRVRRLVAGAGVFICERCADLADEVVAERGGPVQPVDSTRPRGGRRGEMQLLRQAPERRHRDGRGAAPAGGW
jgi:ClpX C4-type zinc finger